MPKDHTGRPTVGQQFRDDHNSTRIMELKDRGNDNPSSAHCAYLRQTFCSSEVLRHEKGIFNEYQHLQNISYSHYTTKQSLRTTHTNPQPKEKPRPTPKKLCRKFGDIFRKFYSERMRRQQAYKGERDTSRRNHTHSSRVSLSRDLTETQYTTTLMLIPGKVLKLSPLHHTVADISSIYLYCREAGHNETTTISLLRS